MKKLLSLTLMVILMSPAVLFAGRQEGILNQFRAAEEAIRNKQMTAEQRKKTLEANLQRGLREAVMRMYYEEKKEWLKDLSPENFFYENPTSPKVYYVRYKSLLIRFDFATNPELYVQGPVLRKVIRLDEATAHAADQAGQSDETDAANQPGEDNATEQEGQGQ